MQGTTLAFDFGLRHIGVAVSQGIMPQSTPLKALKARDGIPDWAKINQLLAEWKPKQLIVGLPLNMDGSESEMSTRARKFARRLHGRSGLSVLLLDERLTSAEAKSLALAHGHHSDFGRDPIDSLAASLILDSWLANPTLAIASL